MTWKAAQTAPTPGLLFLLPTAVSLLLVRFVFATPQEPGGAELLVIVYATMACFSALLFVPVGPSSPSRALPSLIRNCALIVMIFALAVLADAEARTMLGQLVPATIILFLLLMAALTPVLVYEERGPGTRPNMFAVLAILFATPVWLGPLAEQSGNAPGITNFIVGVSPLSALAVALDVDYLRTSWFYKNSPLGSLRYDYVSWTGYVFTLTAIVSTIVIGSTKGAYNQMIIFFRKRVALL